LQERIIDVWHWHYSGVAKLVLQFQYKKPNVLANLLKEYVDTAVVLALITVLIFFIKSLCITDYSNC